MKRIEQTTGKANVCSRKAELAYATSFMCILVLFLLGIAANRLSLNLKGHLTKAGIKFYLLMYIFLHRKKYLFQDQAAFSSFLPVVEEHSYIHFS